MTAPMRIGIDLGGTKIEGIVLDGTGTEKVRVRVSTPRTAYDQDLRTITDLVGELERRVA